jgi:hypothetical protein
MKLTDLSPRWVTPDLFIFKNPTGGECWLSCKRVEMPIREQMELCYRAHPDMKGTSIVPMKADFAWSFTGNNFETMTVTPSIDASSSGNWHGFITNGEIT